VISTLVVDPDLLAQIVEVSADAIFTEDRSGCITTWNAAAERLYGCPAADMIGRSAADLLPAETASQLQAVHDLSLAGERVERFDSWHQRPDGEQFAVSLTVSPLRGPGGEVVGMATSAKNITDRIVLAAHLEDAHRTLEKQYASLERSNHDLEQFAYVASHDLSEPLRAMTGFVQLLERRYADALDERGLRYIAHVVDGAARMRTLIDDLLEYSRFLGAPPECTKVDVGEVARTIAASLADADVEIGELPPVWSDQSSVEAVLQNLLTNAVKFHRPGEPAHVVVSATVGAGMVTLVVDDDGIGILPEFRDRVFRMFSRLHVREAYPGTGIGLAIVAQVALRCGGRAWVEESPLGGSRFCVTFAVPPGQKGST
jgi:PAS domain S-box-containing protein